MLSSFTTNPFTNTETRNVAATYMQIYIRNVNRTVKMKPTLYLDKQSQN